LSSVFFQHGGLGLLVFSFSLLTQLAYIH
jgi:hypothetical protein